MAKRCTKQGIKNMKLPHKTALHRTQNKLVKTEQTNKKNYNGSTALEWSTVRLLVGLNLC